MEADELHIQLLETFMPDDAMFGPESMLHLDHSYRVAHSKESLSFDTDFPTNLLVEDDATSESSVSDLYRFISKSPTQTSMSHVISIRQLLEFVIPFLLNEPNLNIRKMLEFTYKVNQKSQLLILVSLLDG